MATDARVDVLLALKAKLEGFDGAATAVPGLARAVNNAGNAIKQQTRSIGNDVDNLASKIRGAFAPVNLVKGLMAGAGVGGGVALVNLAIDKWADVWKESAEQAKLLEERAQRIAEAMRATAKAAREAFIGGQTPEQQRALRAKEVSDLERKISDLELARANALRGMGAVGTASNIGTRVKSFNGEQFGSPDTGMGGRDFAELMAARADEAQLAMTKVRDDLIKAKSELAKLDKEIADVATKNQAKSAEVDAKIAMDRIASLRTQIESGNKLFLEDLERQKKETEAARKADAEDWAARATAKRAALREEIESGNKIYIEGLKKVSTEQKAFDREVAQLWNNVSDRAGEAFADILLRGSTTFADLGRVIARSLLEIAARMAIINPILNAVFGGFKGFEKLPTFTSTAKAAGGGSFLTRGPTNFTVGDNPGGVEMVNVIPLSGVGRSSINGKNVAMAGGGNAFVGGAGGDTFNFTYSFQGGVSRAEVMGILPSMVEASKGAVLEAKRRRRGGF